MSNTTWHQLLQSMLDEFYWNEHLMCWELHLPHEAMLEYVDLGVWKQ